MRVHSPTRLDSRRLTRLLKGGEPLPLSSDQKAPQRFLLVAFADHVEAIRLACGYLDSNVELELGHELLEDLLGRGHCLGRDLSRLLALSVR